MYLCVTLCFIFIYGKCLHVHVSCLYFDIIGRINNNNNNNNNKLMQVMYWFNLL